MQADSSRILNFFENCWAEFANKEKELFSEVDLGDDISGDVVGFILRRGKRIRPLLFLSAWEAFTGLHVDESVDNLPALQNTALALELLHAFVLVHDDVIDRSQTRRGQPTLHRLIRDRLGGGDQGHLALSMAVVFGDVLFARAFSLMLNATGGLSNANFLRTLFLEVVRDTGLGELRDIQMTDGKIAAFSLEDVERMYHLKTTRYTIELPLSAAYILACDNHNHLGVLAEYSHSIGLAFQITNDLREFQKVVSEEDHLEGDLIEAKKTWLLIKTRDLLGNSDRAFFDVCLESHVRDERFVFKVKHLMEKVAVAEHAAKRISELTAQAECCLTSSDLPPQLAQKLLGLVRDLKSVMFF